MGPQELPESGTYIRLLADHARELQREAREALDHGEYARATALIGDAQMLTEDVHGLVGEIEHREMSDLLWLAACDVRAVPEPPRKRFRFALPARRMRMAIGTGLLMSLALTEW